MKTYVLMVSKTFMKSHPRAGQPTLFAEKIWKGLPKNHPQDKTYTIYHTYPKLLKSGYWQIPITWRDDMLDDLFHPKIHTIRANYEYWSHVEEEVNAGRGILSLRQWTGKPYRSKQKEFARLTKMGVQKVDVTLVEMDVMGIKSNGLIVDQGGAARVIPYVARRDGLSTYDFIAWFNKGIVNGAIIHFTDFRYQ